MSTRRDLLKLSAALVAAPSAFAQGQVVEQVKIYYGFPAGSSGDSVARRVAERLGGSAYTRNPGVVENRAGAGGRIAVELLKQAPSDGSVLTLVPSSCVCVYPHIFTRLSYDPFRDITPVALAAVMHLGVAVGPQVPATVTNLRGFLQWAKENPGHANYASPGAGSTPHFIGALLGMRSGVNMNHIAYRGSVAGISDLVGGQIASMVTTSGDFIPYHRAGRLRVLATSGRRRSPFFPDVPTLSEQGYPDLTVEETFGFYAPAKTPRLLIERANAAINASLKDKALVDSLASLGVITQGSSVEELAGAQRQEYVRWQPLVKAVGFTSDS